MERLPALDEEEEEESSMRQPHGIFSCWGRLRLAAVWRRLKRFQSEQRRRRGNKLYVRRGSLNYDPLSYAQNFDDGGFEGDEEEGERIRRNFSSRFAPPHPSAGIQSRRTEIDLMD